MRVSETVELLRYSQQREDLVCVECGGHELSWAALSLCCLSSAVWCMACWYKLNNTFVCCSCVCASSSGIVAGMNSGWRCSCLAAALLFATLCRPTSCRTWSIVLNSSRFWLNYRHTTDAMAVYQILKAGGLSDSDVREILCGLLSLKPRNSFTDIPNAS